MSIDRDELLKNFNSLADVWDRINIVQILMDTLWETDRVQFNECGIEMPEPHVPILPGPAVQRAIDKWNFVGPVIDD